LKIHVICKTLTQDLLVSATQHFCAGGIPTPVLINGKTMGNPSHQQRQLKITHNAANKWPGNSLLTPNCAFLSSFPVSAVFTCCASLLSLGHASEPAF
jgi:hypothetical protein